jgi:hypothetical protein
MSKVEERHDEILAALLEMQTVLWKILIHLKGGDDPVEDEEPYHHPDWQHGSHIDSMPTQPPLPINVAPPKVK